MLRLAIIIGSTRPGRVGEAVARWAYELAKKRGDAEFELVDIEDFNLPLLDEPVPPSQGKILQAPTPRLGRQKSGPSTATSSLRRSTTTVSRERSRTRSTSCTPSGATRRPASSATAARAECARSSTCGW